MPTIPIPGWMEGNRVAQGGEYRELIRIGKTGSVKLKAGGWEK
jgi:hypothetical protein